jgi:hypothetical protein
MSFRLILDVIFSVNTDSYLICNDRGCGQKKYTNFVQQNLFLQNNTGPERKTKKPNITREQVNLKRRSNALHVSIQKTIEMLQCIFFCYRPTILGKLLQTFQHRCSDVEMLPDVKVNENLSISDIVCCKHKALLAQKAIMR